MAAVPTLDVGKVGDGEGLWNGILVENGDSTDTLTCCAWGPCPCEALILNRVEFFSVDLLLWIKRNLSRVRLELAMLRRSL